MNLPHAVRPLLLLALAAWGGHALAAPGDLDTTIRHRRHRTGEVRRSRDGIRRRCAARWQDRRRRREPDDLSHPLQSRRLARHDLRRRDGHGESPRLRGDALALQPDGKILVGGAVFGAFAVPLRFNPNGRASNPQGILVFEATASPPIGMPSGKNPYVSAIAVQPDGRIVRGGEGTAFR
jgi:hypothetical protein